MEAMMTQAAPAAETPGAATAPPAAPGSAPGSASPPASHTPGSTVDPGAATLQPGGDLPAGLKSDLFKLRQKNREYQSTIQTLSQQVKDLMARIPSAPAPETPGGSSPGLFDDPDRYLEARDKKLMGGLEEVVSRVLESREEKRRVQTSSTEAARWLLSQKELLEDPNAVDEINELLQTDEELARVARASPRIAAKHALELWREQKGLNRGGTNPGRGGTPPPSGGGGTAKVWTKKEVEEYLDYKHPEFKKRQQEILKAAMEGRVK